jgi:hypothetical protein
MRRHFDYRQWRIHVGSIATDSVFKAAAVVERRGVSQAFESDQRFFAFSNHGDLATEDEADEWAMQWARAWVDEYLA